jgi:hypothetical protein
VTREEWLNRVASALAPAFKRQGLKLPPFRVSIGFPSTGRRGHRIGEAHAAVASKDGHHEIFIRPDVDDSAEIAQVLAHELVHCAVGMKAGHGPLFRRAALAIGLLGPMRSTSAGKGFRELLGPILEEVGEIPHAELKFRAGRAYTDAPKKQAARMMKAECPVCGYTVRVSRMWLSMGAPLCPLDRLALKAEAADG